MTERTFCTLVNSDFEQRRPGPKDERSETSFSLFLRERLKTPQTNQ
jgi:hypothetical protein